MTWHPDRGERKFRVRPSFGKQARRWFFRAICFGLEEEWQKAYPKQPAVSFEMAIAVARKLTPRTPEEFTEWAPASGYAGPQFSSGQWYVCWGDVLEDVRNHYAAYVPVPSDEELARGLDTWLREDVRGVILAGATEPRIDSLLGREALVEAKRRRARWPRLCACGAEFRGDRANAVRCPNCRIAHSSQAKRGKS
jgi:hypothetical protein